MENHSVFSVTSPGDLVKRKKNYLSPARAPGRLTEIDHEKSRGRESEIVHGLTDGTVGPSTPELRFLGNGALFPEKSREFLQQFSGIGAATFLSFQFPPGSRAREM